MADKANGTAQAVAFNEAKPAVVLFFRDGRRIIKTLDGKIDDVAQFGSVSEAKSFNRIKLGGLAKRASVRIPGDQPIREVQFLRGEAP